MAAILARARVAHEVDVVRRIEDAVEAVARRPPAAVLVHAEIGRRDGGPIAAPLLAAFCRDHSPRLGVLLYREAGAPPGHERSLALLGVSAPIVLDRRLAASLEVLLSDLLEYVLLDEALRPSAPPPDETLVDGLPVRFSIERCLAELEKALLRAAIHEHPDRAAAAAAVNLRFETFAARLGRHCLEVPRARRPESIRGPSVVWCSHRPPPPAVADALDAEGLGVRSVAPGTLHPGSVLSSSTVAVAVDPCHAATAADIWLLDRSARPFVLLAGPTAPVRLALEALRVTRWCVSPDGAIPGSVLRAGRCDANLRLDEQRQLRLSFRRDGLPAWPLDLPAILRELDVAVLRLARRAAASAEAAARAVGLSESTYRRRLRGGTFP